MQSSGAAGIVKQAVADAWVAQDTGRGSRAMGGFDVGAVAREFGLGALELPVIIVAVGHPAAGNAPQ